MRAVLMMLVLCSGCVTARGVGDATGLRSQDGVCSMGISDMMGGPRIKTCFQVGSPKTLQDDGKTPKVVVEVMSGGISLSDPAGYQLEIVKDGRVIHKEMLNEDTPSYNIAGGTTTWTGIDIVFLEEPFENGTYQINWVASYNTDTKGSSTITLSGLNGKVGVPFNERTNPSKKTPCFEWQSDYEKCKDKSK